MSKLSFNKSERLKSRKRISLLFKEGKVVKAYPIKLIYLLNKGATELPPVQLGVTVPVRNFRKAVKRNRIKRLLREAYRINKAEINPTHLDVEWHIDIMVIFVGRDMVDFETINNAMSKGLKRLKDILKSELE